MMIWDILLLPWLYSLFFGVMYSRGKYIEFWLCDIMKKYIIEALCVLWGNIFLRRYVDNEEIYY